MIVTMSKNPRQVQNLSLLPAFCTDNNANVYAPLGMIKTQNNIFQIPKISNWRVVMLTSQLVWRVLQINMFPLLFENESKIKKTLKPEIMEKVSSKWDHLPWHFLSRWFSTIAVLRHHWFWSLNMDRDLK